MNLEEHLSSSDREVAKVILAIAEKSKDIRKAFLTRTGSAGTVNASGEEQENLETYADQLLIQAMRDSGVVRTIASEEQNDSIDTGQGKLGVVFDPLDGSSCIRTNLAVGTLAGIFEGAILGDVRIVGALHILYGPLTTLLYSTGRGVHKFVLEGEGFILKKENVRMPEGNLLSSGGLKKDFTPAHLQVIDKVEGEGFKLRYTGSFAADFSQIMEYGGFYCYPALKEKPEGKLRLLFEAYPMSFLASQAGGKATNGARDILDIRPEKVHQRTPLYIGSKGVVEAIRI